MGSQCKFPLYGGVEMFNLKSRLKAALQDMDTDEIAQRILVVIALAIFGLVCFLWYFVFSSLPGDETFNVWLEHPVTSLKIWQAIVIAFVVLRITK